MRIVRWSAVAELAYNDLLDRRILWSEAAADRAENRVDEAVELIAIRPMAGRHSRRWRGYYEKSVRREQKIIVYQFDDAELRILLFLDSRQDLDAILLPRE